MDYPFTLLKRKDRPFYYVRFRDSITGKLTTWRSTGQTSKAEAVKVAMQWYTNGIPTTAKADGKKQTVQNCIKIHKNVSFVHKPPFITRAFSL